MAGQIKASPEVHVEFYTLATTAIQRSAQGILCIILKDETKKTKWNEIKTIDDLVKEEWDEKSFSLISLAMQTFSPNKILVRVMQEDETDYAKVLKELKQRRINWLACPSITEASDDITVATWVKQVFGTTSIDKTIKYVSSYADKSDHVAIVELANKETYKSRLGDFTAQEYTVAIAGMLAGIPLNCSADNLTMADLIEVEDTEPALGKFSLYNDDGKVRVNYAINSKTTYDSTWKKETRKIKVVEGMCIVVDDIRTTFKNYWLGIYINNYDNKMNFCSNVTKVYFKELAPNVLSADYENKIEIDLEKQRSVVVLDSKDPDEMSEFEVLQYPSGDDVYLTGDVRFADTMANLTLKIKM